VKCHPSAKASEVSNKDKRDPIELGRPEGEAFLTSLALERRHHLFEQRVQRCPPSEDRRAAQGGASRMAMSG